MNDPRGRPDHVDAARAMFFTLLAVGAIWALSLRLKRAPPEGFSLLMQAAFLSIPLLYARASKLRPFEASGYARLGLRQIALVLFASLGTMWLLQGLNLLQEPVFRWLGWEREMKREVDLLTKGLEEAQEKGLPFAAFLFGIVSPFCEETFFRGLVFRGFARRFGLLISLGVTTLCFAAMHQTLVQFALMFVLGIYFGTLVWLTGSLWAGILAHASNNLAVVLLTKIYGAKMEALRAPWWMYALSAIVFAGAMALLALDRRGKEVTSK